MQPGLLILTKAGPETKKIIIKINNNNLIFFFINNCIDIFKGKNYKKLLQKN